MTTLDALLAGIVADPLEETRWLVLADWLEENDDPRRAEFLRLHRKMLATCCEPDAHPERTQWQARMTELLIAGVKPCVPQETLTLPGGVPMTFSFIPPGAFLMGSDRKLDDDSELQPVKQAELRQGFFMSVYPVTQPQWRTLMDATPSKFKGPARPVESVSCNDCERFCAILSELTGRRVKLPTELEWECACRAGTTTDYYFGEVPGTDIFNYYGYCTWNGSHKGVRREQTTDVDSFLPNAWSLYDLHGNVWELCYSETPPPPDQPEKRWVYRGGCYEATPYYCRAASRRMPYFDWHSDSDLGLRVCLCLS